MEAVTDVFDLSEPHTHNDMLLARRIGEALETHYPGWAWAVSIDLGVVNVVSLKLSGTWGFTFKIEQITGDMKNVIRAGGEVLERFNARRGRFTVDAWRDADDFPFTDGLSKGRRR